MSEKLLQQALLEACEKEFAPFEDGEEHRFSRRHKRKMKELFKEYSRGDKKKMPLKKRIIIAVIAVLLAALTGATAAAVGQRFGIFNVSITHTEVGVIDAEDAPKRIEDIYYIPVLPEGYGVYQYTARAEWVSWIIPKVNGGGELLFSQNVKEDYSSRINNQNSGINFIDVGEYEGYYVDFGYDQLSLEWDHGDYVMGLFSVGKDFTIDDLIELALSIQVDPELEYGERIWDL